MVKPEPIVITEPKDLKLGIKSSIPKVKSLISLTYILWRVTNLSELDYSEEYSSNNKTLIKIKDILKNNIIDYFDKEIKQVGITKHEFCDILDNNQLTQQHMESLIVALELVWKIAEINFCDDSLPFNHERSGGSRYAKKLKFTLMVDYIDSCVLNNEENFKKVFFMWITDKNISVDNILEKRLMKIFTLMSEKAIYRVRIDDNEDIKFMNTGIYSQLIKGNKYVNIKDYKEKMGSLRILNTALKENFNYYIKSNNWHDVGLQDHVNKLELIEYNKRVKSYLNLTHLNLDELLHSDITSDAENNEDIMVYENNTDDVKVKVIYPDDIKEEGDNYIMLDKTNLKSGEIIYIYQNEKLYLIQSIKNGKIFIKTIGRKVI